MEQNGVQMTLPEFWLYFVEDPVSIASQVITLRLIWWVKIRQAKKEQIDMTLFPNDSDCTARDERSVDWTWSGIWNGGQVCNIEKKYQAKKNVSALNDTIWNSALPHFEFLFFLEVGSRLFLLTIFFYFYFYDSCLPQLQTKKQNHHLHRPYHCLCLLERNLI